MNQTIPVITEQYHSCTWWFYAITKMIAQCAGGHRLKLRVYKQGLSQGEIKGLADVAFVASHSDVFLRQAVSALNQAGKKAILIMENGYNYGAGVSSVAPSHRHQAWLVYTYLKQCGRDKIALIGFRRDYSRCLYEALLAYAGEAGVHLPDTALFFNRFSGDYFQRFIDEAVHYDAVVCPNYQVALMLLSLLKRNRIRVPEDLFVVAFSNAIAAEYTSPQLTTVSIDAKTVGQACFDLWLQMMRRGHSDISTCINVLDWLRIRKSTADIPFAGQSAQGAMVPLKPFEDATFYSGDISRDVTLYNLEICLQQCDSIDIDLIRLLLEGLSYEAIAERLFISIGSLRYRVAKLYANAGMGNRKQFEQLFKMRLTSEEPFAPDGVDG